MEIFLITALFVLGLFFVIKGGDWFVDSSVFFARYLGIPQVIVGATIVSIGTTLPEALIGTFAALQGSGDIIAGTALGSILCNTGLILGVNILIKPIEINSKDTFLKVGSMVGIVVLLGILGSNAYFSRVDGLILLFLFVAYMASNIYTGTHNSGEEKISATPQELKKSFLLFLVGLVMVVGGARVLLDSGVELARILGISEALIAITLLAVGSSLPELATSVTAALKGHNGLFFGNVLGANILNGVLVVGTSSAIKPFTVSLPEISGQVITALVLMAVLVIPSFFTRRITRTQGLIAFVIYLGFIVYMVLTS